jgi:hypothetical protein
MLLKRSRGTFRYRVIDRRDVRGVVATRKERHYYRRWCYGIGFTTADVNNEDGDNLEGDWSIGPMKQKDSGPGRYGIHNHASGFSILMFRFNECRLMTTAYSINPNLKS